MQEVSNRKLINHLYKFILYGCILILSGCGSLFSSKDTPLVLESSTPITQPKVVNPWEVFSSENNISLSALEKTIQAYSNNNTFKKDTIVIIDYAKPSTEKRFYVIDISQKKVLYNTLVAHGKNTGQNMAINFSNVHESFQSSLGVFKTAEIYIGKNGVSLRIDGLIEGINDNVRDRNIVIHGADYVSQDFIDRYGRLGRSHGCPALPVSISKEIINVIANGACLYIHGDIDNLAGNDLLATKL